LFDARPNPALEVSRLISEEWATWVACRRRTARECSGIGCRGGCVCAACALAVVITCDCYSLVHAILVNVALSHDA
jgi:hypothetical protein